MGDPVPVPDPQPAPVVDPVVAALGRIEGVLQSIAVCLANPPVVVPAPGPIQAALAPERKR